jgi:hypothetical protein
MSSLQKRTYNEAFGQRNYETERYDESVDEDYFKNGGVGHGVYNESPVLFFVKPIFKNGLERENSKTHDCKISSK